MLLPISHIISVVGKKINQLVLLVELKVADIELPAYVKTAFVLCSSVGIHCIRRSISVAGARQHMSLKKVTVSA